MSRTAIGMLVSLFLLLMIVGCAGGSGSGFTVTEFKDGKVVGTHSVETYATDLTKDKYSITVKDGKLSWSLKISNPMAKRGYCLGTLTAYTNVSAIVVISFDGTVEAGAVDAVIGEKDIVVKDMPKEWQIVDTSGNVTPAAGTETPTYSIPGNWPLKPMQYSYKAEFAKPAAVVREVVKPVKFSPSVRAKGVPAEGGTAQWAWEVLMTNQWDREVVCDVEILVYESVLDDDPKNVSPVLRGGKPNLYKVSRTLGAGKGKTKKISGDATLDLPAKACAISVELVRVNGIEATKK